ncbi:amidase signature enzyme [Stereum hirsutum FP-91666 SS1]|uniref:amidase signature enzyme n=1 Tax=Stereum hirsutum (strain FP-91666) TaxID=721885 RepID=UPI000444A403|nr:amidase signature enzyme [Stereum hirsutum FP-91666 SS1]EIM85123.1 amidase signature enzyme [Stereum hirsutum FP-91666 SS1]
MHHGRRPLLEAKPMMAVVASALYRPILLDCPKRKHRANITILISFFVPAEPVASLPGAPLVAEIVPFTVFASTGNGSLTDETLAQTVGEWDASDDVFDSNFLQAVLIQGSSSGSAHVSSSAFSFFSEQGTQVVLTSGKVTTDRSSPISTKHIGTTSLAPGPYILARDATGSPAVYTPLRLHFDVTQSFFKSVTAKSDGSFAVVSASLDTDSSPYIGVPSKVYAASKNKTELPLAGVRVSVKDIYYLKGLKTSAGNRHFYSLYPPRNATGPAVSKLMDLGAHIVGTTKTVQFANGDRATVDWVDYHAPFVLRGDGNREPSGSSTGAGAGVSALDFVDVGIGSDTGGSIRGPSGVNGLYGIRPSVGAISLDEVVPLNDVLDTGGFIARDPNLFATFGKSWYSGSFDSYSSFPTKMFVSSEFESVSDAAFALYSDFFDKVKGYLGAEVTSNFSIPGYWNETSDVGVPLTTLLNTTYATMVAYHQWTVVGQPFFSDFAAANEGRNPHINPAVLARWQYGESQGADGYAAALIERETFENWTSSQLFKEDAESCSDSLFFYPQNAGDYTSREVYYPSIAAPPFGYSSGRLAVHGRSPDMVVPIGQVPYHSNITGITEQLPVTVSIVTRRGCDFVLFDLLEGLAAKGIVQTVKTGRTAF